MKTLNLTLDLTKLNLSEEEKKRNQADIVAQVVENVILTYGQQQRGFTEQERRQCYKISDALEEAKKVNATEVQVEDDWAGFIRKCFREAKLMPNGLLKQIEVHVANLKGE